MERQKIKIAVVGVGNCASSLIQGIHHYRLRGVQDSIGLLNYELGGYRPEDIEVVAAFDIDKRKVGRDVNEAIFSLPNCTAVFCPDLPPGGVTVSMGNVLDGYSEHMAGYGDDRTFLLCSDPQPSLADVVAQLKDVNERLWVIEDDIRDCERAKDFGDEFVRLARAVYVSNDERAAVKRAINELLGSRLVEEKSYATY